MSKDPERLYFPGEIADDIGRSSVAISAMKKRGCKFHGRKTTIRWVREFIEKEATPIPTVAAAQSAHEPASVG